MVKQRKPYKKYSSEFKREAVRLMNDSGRPASEVAMELGIRRNQLYKWKTQLDVKGVQAFTGRGRPRKDAQSEVSRLKQENDRLREENEILKKAAVFFAKELG
ncbi:MAG: transposase [Gammaproteobacteria bacterium]|jgi:transposase